MAKKVTKEIARIRGIPEGIDLRSPSRHPDVLGADDLVIKVEEFREATGYTIPVSVKLGAGTVAGNPGAGTVAGNPGAIIKDKAAR